MTAVTDAKGNALTPAEMVFYETALVSSTYQEVTAELWDRSRAFVASIVWADGPAPSGQVNIDTTSAAGRSATLSTIDEDNELKLGTDVLFLDRILRLEHRTYVPEIEGFGVCPMFTGPCMAPTTTGPLITLEAQGMELWARGDVKTVHRWPKGALVTSVIRQIMVQLVGEQSHWMDVPEMPFRLPAPFQIGPQWDDDGYWGACQYLAESIGADLFYDGASVCCLRRPPTPPKYAFRTGIYGSVIGVPQVSTLVGGQRGSANDAAQIVNDSIVFGQAAPQKPPAGGGKPPEPPVIRGEAIVPAGNRLAPGSLGHPNAAGLFLKDIVTNDHIRLNSTAQRISKNRLQRFMQMAEQATLQTVVIPHLDPYDRYRVMIEGDLVGTYQMMQASIPLSFSESTPMTVGVNALVSSPPRRRR